MSFILSVTHRAFPAKQPKFTISPPPSLPFFRTRRFRSRRGSDERFVDLVDTHYFRNYVRFCVCGKKEGLKLTNPTYISVSQP